MKSKWLGAFVMGALSLVLFTALEIASIGRTGSVVVIVFWLASVSLTMAIARRAPSPRDVWGQLSLVNAVLTFAVIATNAVTPLPSAEAAAYEPGNDWLHSVDMTPPMVARLREAMASGYAAISIIILGLIFLSIGYLLLHRPHGSRRHAH